MDKYMEDECARAEFFEGLISNHKKEVLKKFDWLSKDDDINEKFITMLMQAECEGCDYAEEFVQHFNLTELDKAAMFDCSDIFIQQYLEDREQDYISSNFEV